MTLRHTFLTALLATAAATPGLEAQGIPVGFEETYALAEDRAAVVAQLIPGTADSYYYRCRERLDAGDFAAVRAMLPTWIERHGRTARVLEIENREALLSFGQDPDRTFDFLRQRLGLRFQHERAVPGARSDLPTSLDPAQLSPTALTQRAFERHPGTVDGFRPHAFLRLAAAALSDEQLHSLLRRLDRPDVPNLPALIVRDLQRRESRGFGSLGVHKRLRRGQLDECISLRPALLQDSRFVAAYLTRLQPDADTALYEDPAQRARHLEQLWSFARRLSSSFNSLKAHVLYHWLRHDLTQGAPDRQRFLDYIRLPRRSGHVSKAHLERFDNRAAHVDLRRKYPSLLDPVRSDDALVRACLEQLFLDDDSVDSYSSYLDKRWLQRVLAETKLLAGVGDPERWYSLLDDPARLEQLEQRVELRFPATMPQTFAADAAVQLQLDTKNVQALVVKVFEIDAFRYHVERQKAVDASIDLDGVVANFERTYEYDEAPIRRVRRSFDLPMLRDPGTYVVDFVGGGISSRAVLHKGELRMVERTSAAGQLVRVYDERGVHQPDAVAWFGGREYAADDRGDVLIPFSTDPGEKQLVLRRGARSSIVPFAHRGERYALEGGAHLDRESLLADGTATLVVRPQLRLAGHPVSLGLLEQPLLVVTATDVDGKSTRQEVRDLELADGRELTHEFRVPARLTRVDVSLSAKVTGMDGEPVSLTGCDRSFSFNEIDATAETGVPMLARTPAGYIVELRGKSGEVQAGRVCRVTLTHRDYVDKVQVALQTDSDGRITLGRLDGVTAVDVSKDGGGGGSFALAGARAQLPSELHAAAGETLRLPYQGREDAPTRAEMSLLAHNVDAFDKLAIVDGFLELRDLAPGDYELRLHDAGHRVTVRVTQGQRDGRFLIGRDRALSATPSRPLHVVDVTADGEQVRVQLANATSSTRVHAVATRYLPAYDLFEGLRGAPGRAPAAATLDRLVNSYDAGRKLSDEYRYVLERRFAQKYPGNMLERPSLLLHPMELDENSWNSAIGLGGGAGGRFGGRARGRRSGPAGAPAASAQTAESSAGARANLDFLPEGSRLLTNLVPDSAGVVTIPLADLGRGQHVHVVALDGDQAVYDATARAEQRLTPRSRALPRSLPTEQHFLEDRRIEFVATGAEVTIDASAAPALEVYDTFADAFQLFTTIRKDPSLQKFAFLMEWPALDRDRKLKLYGEHACHELHFFLHEKDPEFFAAVVQPLLADKLDKTFLDEWLLERDLRAYLDPWRFARLNLVEKILLARRLGGAEPAAVARMLREALELRPIDRAQQVALFEMALMSTGLRTEERQLESIAGLADLDEALEGAEGKPGAPNESPRRSLRRMRAPNGPGSPGPTGPATGGPAGPPRGGGGGGSFSGRPTADDKAGLAKRKATGNEQQRLGRAGERDAAAAEDRNGADDFFLGREMEQRQQVRRLYEGVAETRLLVEHNYWRRTINEATTDVIPVNSFWVDYATAPTGAPFVSTALAQASGSFVEMMFALSVLDLPYEAAEHQVRSEGMQRTLTAASPLLLVRKEIAPVAAAADAEPLLLGQNFFRLDDRYRWVDGERRDAFVTDEFLVDVAYGCQVVVTNPSSRARVADVLLQVPAGAVPLQRARWTHGRQVALAPFATQTLEYSFYFPEAGAFDHYPAHAAEKGQLAAFAAAQRFEVVAEPSTVDASSWEHVSQQSSPAEVITYLGAHNVQRLDLTKLCWRLRDRAFYEALLPELRRRHVYDGTVWSYALLHRDPRATAEFLRHRDDFLARCGRALASPLVDIDPKERGAFQHLELSPLVHQRAHQLGSQRVFGNKDLAGQYAALMTVLGYRPELDSADWLAVTYYLLLQDRVGEALAAFERVDAAEVEAQVQYDYLSAYLCFFTGDVARARRLATKRADHPATRWRARFREVLAQLDEAEGKPRDGAEEQTPETLAATAPALELAVTGRDVAVSYRNLRAIEVRYYELDVEFAFSAQPFAGPDGAAAAFVKPNFQETRSLDATAAQLRFELPQQFWQKNVLVEVRADGLVRSRQYFANALDVRFLESYGQVAVAEQEGERPLAKTYVKVFARMPNGDVRFHKDGYTDLRGRFDYVSLSDDPNRGATRYAVLVLDDQRGAVIREINPPAR